MSRFDPSPGLHMDTPSLCLYPTPGTYPTLSTLAPSFIDPYIRSKDLDLHLTLQSCGTRESFGGGTRPARQSVGSEVGAETGSGRHTGGLVVNGRGTEPKDWTSDPDNTPITSLLRPLLRPVRRSSH